LALLPVLLYFHASQRYINDGMRPPD